MKYVDEFRDPAKARVLLRRDPQVERGASRVTAKRPLQIMEVCGGHTHSIFRYGIQQMLPDAVEFVHGPGCPVCVLPMGRVDDCVALAERPEVIFTTFGDAMRVPGSRKSLLKAKADGADVRMVYSPLDALAIARKHPDREVIFFGLGFETTMPSTAMTVIAGAQRRACGISRCSAITSPSFRRSRRSWTRPTCTLDGFLGPGPCQHGDRHRPYEFIARHYRKPITIAGFEPLDVLQSTVDGAEADRRGPLRGREPVWPRRSGERQSARRSPRSHEVYELREFFEWRGLGSIDHSGVRMRDELCRVRRRTEVRACPTSGSPIRRPASAARC